MAETIISYKVDLAVRLLDTTTGRSIAQQQVTFLSGGQMLLFQKKGDGLYVLLNHGREDMRLHISALGYLPVDIEICYAALSEKLPEAEVALIPESSTNRLIEYQDLKGCIPGITSITAVSLKKVHGLVIGYQPRKQSIRLYYGKEFDENSYALIREDQQSFEEFQVRRRISSEEIVLSSPLVSECRPKDAIGRIVRGKVDEKGNYLLRILTEGKNEEYLVRYTVDGQNFYGRFSEGEPEALKQAVKERS